MRLIAISAVLLLSSCMARNSQLETEVRRPTIATNLNHGEPVQLSGWLTVDGEGQLFDSEAAMQLELRYPYCISGVIPDALREQARQLNYRRVNVTVIPYTYETLPRENSPFPTRRVVGGAPIGNWCFGDYVYIMQSIEEP